MSSFWVHAYPGLKSPAAYVTFRPRLTLRVHHLCRLCMLHCVPWSAEFNESFSHSFSCCVSVINRGLQRRRLSSKWFTKFASLGSLEVGCHPWESKATDVFDFYKSSPHFHHRTFESLRQAKKNVSAPIHRGALLNAAEVEKWSESCIIGVASFSLPTHLRKMENTRHTNH